MVEDYFRINRRAENMSPPFDAVARPLLQGRRVFLKHQQKDTMPISTNSQTQITNVSQNAAGVESAQNHYRGSKPKIIVNSAAPHRARGLILSSD